MRCPSPSSLPPSRSLFFKLTLVGPAHMSLPPCHIHHSQQPFWTLPAPTGTKPLPPLCVLGSFYLIENSTPMACFAFYLVTLTLGGDLDSGCVLRAWHQVSAAQLLLLECKREGALPLSHPSPRMIFALCTFPLVFLFSVFSELVLCLFLDCKHP